MDAEALLESLHDGLVAGINLRRDNLRAEADDLKAEWAALGRTGGQRPDHAAGLLARLLPHLAELRSFASACCEQIEEARFPFEREDE